MGTKTMDPETLKAHPNCRKNAVSNRQSTRDAINELDSEIAQHVFTVQKMPSDGASPLLRLWATLGQAAQIGGNTRHRVGTFANTLHAALPTRNQIDDVGSGAGNVATNRKDLSCRLRHAGRPFHQVWVERTALVRASPAARRSAHAPPECRPTKPALKRTLHPEGGQLRRGEHLCGPRAAKSHRVASAELRLQTRRVGVPREDARDHSSRQSPPCAGEEKSRAVQ